MIFRRIYSAFHWFSRNIIANMIISDIMIIYYGKGVLKMIGDKVKELRKLLDMTQKDLAEKLGLKSQTTIAAIENNKNKPSNELLSRMSDLFKVSTDFLLEKVEQDGGYLRLLLSAKLNKKMKEEKMTVEELAKKLNIPSQHLMVIKNGQGDMDALDSYRAVAEYSGLSMAELNFLMSSSYKPLKIDLPQESEEYSLNSTEAPSLRADIINIPILGVVRAGSPILANENIEGYMPLSTSMISGSKDYFALKVKGDSMNLEFNEGSIIIVEKTNIIENGQIGIVLVNDYEATVKKIVKNKNMITLIPMSSNSVYTPTMYDMANDEIKIVGKVKLAIKSY
jgi:repressor LexA